MSFILAQTAGAVPPGTMDFLAVLAFFALLGDRLISIVQRLFKTPEKREVSFASEYVSKTDFVELKETVESHERAGIERRREIYGMIKGQQEHTDKKFDQLRSELKTDVDGLHARVTQVLDRVSELKGEVKQIAKRGEG